MAYNSKKILKDIENKAIPQQFDQANDTFEPLKKMEYYGSTVANRPAANAVPVGALYCAVLTQEYWQSDGSQWVVV